MPTMPTRNLKTPELPIYEKGKKYRLAKDVEMLTEILSPNMKLDVSCKDPQLVKAGTIVEIIDAKQSDVLTGDSFAGLPSNRVYRLSVAGVPLTVNTMAEENVYPTNKLPHVALALRPRADKYEQKPLEPGLLVYVIQDTGVQPVEHSKTGKGGQFKPGDLVWITSFPQTSNSDQLEPNFEKGFYNWVANARQEKRFTLKTPSACYLERDYLLPGEQ